MINTTKKIAIDCIKKEIENHRRNVRHYRNMIHEIKNSQAMLFKYLSFKPFDYSHKLYSIRLGNNLKKIKTLREALRNLKYLK